MADNVVKRCCLAEVYSPKLCIIINSSSKGKKKVLSITITQSLIRKPKFKINQELMKSEL